MGLKDNVKTIDDLIRLMHRYFDKMETQLLELNLYQKASEVILNANNTEEQFKADLVSKYIEELQRIRLQLEYLDAPIIDKGYLRIMEGNMVYLGDRVLSEGANLEYFGEEQWHFGVLHQDQFTKSYVISTWDGKIIVEKIEKLQVRIRG